MVVRLDDISVGDEDVDAAFRAWRRAIEGAHNGSVRGHAAFTLTVGEPDLAYNIAPQAVTGNAWIAVMWVDTEWLCIYEICPA
jgi:hypothetical protein